MVTSLVPAIAALICFLVIAFYIEVQSCERQKRAELTFEIYHAQMAWLKTHKEFGNWLAKSAGPPGPDCSRYDFDEYLGYFEDLYILKRRGLLDKKLMYDLFGKTLISVYEANNHELNFLTEDMKNNSDDCYEWVDILYRDMKHHEKMEMGRAEGLFHGYINT